MDQFSVLNTIFYYLDPGDYLSCLTVSSLWSSIVILHIRKLFSWTKFDLMIRYIRGKNTKSKGCFLTPSVFCVERGIKFVIDREKNLLKIFSAHGNSFNFYLHLNNLDDLTHINYTIFPSTPRQYYIVIYRNSLCKSIIDCSNIMNIKTFETNFKIEKKSIESLSWFYFQTNNSSELPINFPNIKIAPQNLPPKFYWPRFVQSSTKNSLCFVIVEVPDYYLIYSIRDNNIHGKKILNIKHCGVNFAKDFIFVNDEFFVLLDFDSTIGIVNLINDERFSVLAPGSTQLCSIIGNKFMWLSKDSIPDDHFNFSVFDLSSRTITQTGVVTYVPWFKEHAFFNEKTNELFFWNPGYPVEKLKIK